MNIKGLFGLLIILQFFPSLYSQSRVIKLEDNNEGRIFEGIGALSAGASSKL